jgi:hypothetical protein
VIGTWYEKLYFSKTSRSFGTRNSCRTYTNSEESVQRLSWVNHLSQAWKRPEKRDETHQSRCDNTDSQTDLPGNPKFKTLSQGKNKSEAI